MKKIFFIFIMVFCFIGIVNAENCQVITGDGTNLGDEIKCGTESFYVINYDENQTELLAKYNLLAGDKIDAFEIPDEDAWSQSPDLTELCKSEATSRGYDYYYVYPRPDKKICRVYEKLNPDHIRQDPKAEGTKIANNDSVLPIYGISYMLPGWGYDSIVKGIIHKNEYDNNGNLIIENSSVEEYLVGYKNELQSQGINVVSVEMPGINRMKKFAEDISGKEIVSNIEEPDFSDGSYPYFYTEKMDIKEYVPEKFKWVYDRAYWLGSGYKGQRDYFDYYISNEGYLCLMGRAICLYFRYPTGNGVRPVVVINNEYIESVTFEENSKEWTDPALNGDHNEEKENPKTADIAITLLVALMILSLIIMVINEKKRASSDS